MFLPRSVSRRGAAPAPLPSVQLAPAPATSDGSTQSDTLARELALLLDLVLSDGHLSLDSSNLELGKWLSRLDYLPLSTLLSHPIFQFLPSPLPPPALIAKHIRLLAPSLSVRLLLDEPRSFGGSRGVKEGSGGLEVGRKGGWKKLEGLDDQEGRLDREVYLEYIPSRLHSPLTLYSFLLPLLPSLPHPLIALSPGPYRNYVHLVFSSPSLAQTFINEWSWEGAKTRAASGGVKGGGGGKEREEAVKAGMRALPKRDFNVLQGEYLSLQTSLTPSSPTSNPPPLAPLESAPAPQRAPPPSGAHPPTPPPRLVAPTTQYPDSCILFIKNLNPSTSKTALKEMLSHLLSTGPLSARGEKGEVSYVDWVKGGDTAQIRLPHRSLSTHLLLTLSRSNLFHLPLISPSPYLSPTPPSADARSLTGEVFTGEKERLAWSGVKENLKLEAVRVAFEWDGQPAPASVEKRVFEVGVQGEERKGKKKKTVK